MKTFRDILTESEIEKSSSRIIIKVPSDKNANEAMSILKGAGLKIGKDWDWITSKEIVIGKSVWKKVSNKLDKFK